MKSFHSLLYFLLGISLATGFTTGPCQGTPSCQCKWSTGKRMADCTGSGFTNVPTTLSSDIQALILDRNPLRKLDKDVFKTAGLLNIQSLSLRDCGLEFVDDNAFRDLKIMTTLDMSNNNITKIDPKTFDGNQNLRTMKLSYNPLSSLAHYQFPPLNALKTIDLSDCQLRSVDRMAFKNLGGSVESVLLHNNNLRYLRDEVFISLVNLKSLTLHSNPWKCDCRLKNFRDWVVNKGLFNRPTSCVEPSRLNGKTWDAIMAAEFACKPNVELPVERYFAAPGVDATLACKVLGSPVPHTRWVVNGRIVNNNSYPQPFADQTYILREERITYDGVERWFNLTITRPGEHDLGQYLCVAENNGGVMEKAVVLTFDDPANYSTGIPMTDEQWHIVIGALVCILLILLLTVIFCYCCWCKGKKNKETKNRTPHSERNGYISDDHAKLISPSTNGSILAVSSNNAASVTKPPRTMMMSGSYQGLPQEQQTDLGYVPAGKYEIEMQDLRAPSVVSSSAKPGSSSASSSASERTASVSRASYIGSTGNEHHGPYPDLLDHTQFQVRPGLYATLMRPGSSDPSKMHMLSPSNLMLTPQQQMQYAHLISTSPFQRSGTLPHHHQLGSNPLYLHHHPHMVSPGTLTVVQQQQQQQPHQPMSRPGYVTLPRRPRSSWSVPRDTPSPSNSVLSAFRTADREPIYDGVGPRTSADGSSRLNLNKQPLASPNTKQQPQQQQQQQPQNQQSRYLLPYYAPIEELQECPPTPKSKPTLANSTPNMLEAKSDPLSASLNASSSEATLMEENLSAYCEPFGTAEKPSIDSKEDSRHSITSNESDSSKKKKKTSSSEKSKQKLKSTKNENNSLKPKCSSTPLRNGDTSLINNGEHHPNNNSNSSVLSEIPFQNGTASNFNNTNHNNSNNKKQSASNNTVNNPPKTLPKPKVKPVPPPKPKKSFQESSSDCSQAPLISFQDECLDGSEV